MARRIGRGILILSFWLALWAGIAALVGRELLLPGPWVVCRRLGELVVTAELWQTVGVSLARILLGAAAGIALGTLLAALTCRVRALDALLSPLLTIVRSTPVASFILLVLIWVGRDILPSVIVLIMVVPVVWANVAAGVRGTAPDLLAMARVYRFPAMRTLRRVYVPSVMPHFLSACQTALGLAWKAGVAAEVLTVPRLAIGKHLYESKLYLETVDLFAWTVVVILCSLVIDKLLAALIGRLRRRRTGGDAV